MKTTAQDILFRFDYTVRRHYDFTVLSIGFERRHKLLMSVPVFSYVDPPDVSNPFIPVLFAGVMFVMFVPTATPNMYESIARLLTPLKSNLNVDIADIVEDGILTTTCVRPQEINGTSYYVILVKSVGANMSKFKPLEEVALQVRTSLRNIPTSARTLGTGRIR